MANVKDTIPVKLIVTVVMVLIGLIVVFSSYYTVDEDVKL